MNLRVATFFATLRVAASLAIAALAVVTAPVLAASEQGARVVYTASDFDKYSPQTALDMVERVPGFSIEDGADLRGFGATAGNVLIDGQRPTSKSGVRDALSRIPAKQVERIEVLRGGALTAEAQGQTIVVNVVRKKASSSGTWSLFLERAGDGFVYPHGEASFTTPVGAWDTSFKVNALWERYPFRGRREISDGSGVLLERWQDQRPSVFSEAYASGEASRAIAGGLLRVNARFGWEGFNYDLDSLIFTTSPDDASADFGEKFSYDSTTIRAEAGIDFSRIFAEDWTWKIVGVALGNVFAEDQRRSRDTLPALAPISRTALSLDQKPAEVVLRTTFARGGTAALRPEFGIEAAYNRLDSALQLSANGVPIDLPAANVLVQELRGEAFGNLTWTVDDALTLEGGVAIEASKITVTGDAEEEQKFFFWKPHVVATWTIGPATKLRGGLRHTVGQLDFTDFAASAQIQDNIPIAGNPSLAPTQTTRAFAILDHRWAREGALTLEVFGERRKDVLEYVILPSGGEGLSNAGEADVWGAIASATLPLDEWVKGARVTAKAKLSASRFDDPLTGETREVNGFSRASHSAEFRHNIPDTSWAWGVNYSQIDEPIYYYTDEIDRRGASVTYGAFVETTIDGALKLTLNGRNLTTDRWTRERELYNPDRSGALDRMDRRWNTRGIFLSLTASAAF